VATPAGPVPSLLPPGSWDDGDPRLDAVPALGQHTDAILAELGLDAATIAALRAEQAI
jgi:itaconate CoA-transferase